MITYNELKNAKIVKRRKGKILPAGGTSIADCSDIVYQIDFIPCNDREIIVRVNPTRPIRIIQFINSLEVIAKRNNITGQSVNYLR